VNMAIDEARHQRATGAVDHVGLRRLRRELRRSCHGRYGHATAAGTRATVTSLRGSRAMRAPGLPAPQSRSGS
jgi:hypothetical protein